MTDYRYASGEEPRAGDIVRSLKDVPAGPRKVGDVFTCLEVCPHYPGVYYNTLTHGDPETFELIARAGEPVEFLPGDNIEFTAKHAELAGSRHSMVRRVGDRYTVVPPFSGMAAPGVVFFQKPDGDKTWAPREYFKLVYRPAPAKEPLSFTPPEPQVGDRVRVVFTGEIKHREMGDRPFRVADENDIGFWVPTSARVEILERAEKPLAVGDRVKHKVGTDTYTVETLSRTAACLRNAFGGLSLAELRHIERVS